MSGIRILQIAHDHPDFTPGGTEVLAHGLARALDATDAVDCSFLAASTSLTRPKICRGALASMVRTICCARAGMTASQWRAATGPTGSRPSRG